MEAAGREIKDAAPKVTQRNQLRKYLEDMIAAFNEEQ
jgi:hypothetical protein